MKRGFAYLIALAFAATLCACAPGAPAAPATPPASQADLSVYPAVDMSRYTAFGGTNETLSTYYDVSVLDVQSMMAEGKSFVLFCAFPDCPWCEALLPILDEVAAEAGWPIALIDTRKDPSWKSNLDIDDYDVFKELFGDYLEEDENGEPHLYVPDLYFVRDGVVVEHRQGVLEGFDDPNAAFTDAQRAELAGLLRGYFAKL